MEGVALARAAAQARAQLAGTGRKRLPFRAVNRSDRPGHQPEMQRHHLLPCQLLANRGLVAMFGALGCDRVGFDDFRRNGLLLPASVPAALRSGLPLHRGPHRDYNGMVAERVGQIEASWSREAKRNTRAAATMAIMRMDLLQRALRRRLLDPHACTLRLSRKDPFRSGQDFAELDAMADLLWAGTARAN